MNTLAEEIEDRETWGSAPPPKIDEDELDLLAFRLWHLGSSIAADDDVEWLDAEEALLCHGGS